MATDWVAIQAALHAWVVGGTGLAASQVVWGGQDAPRPEGVAVTLLIPNISPMGSWEDHVANPLVLATQTVSAVDATANTLTVTAHTFVTGDGPVLVASTGTLPGGVPATGLVWVIKVDANTIKLAETFYDAMNGAPASPAPIAIDISSAGTGTITIATNADSLRAGQEIKALSMGYSRLTLELRCHSASIADGAIATGNNMAVAVLERVRARKKLPSQKAILDNANLGLGDVDRVRGIMGIRDALLFEPRAYLDVHIVLPYQDEEDLTIITRALIEGPMNGSWSLGFSNGFGG